MKSNQINILRVYSLLHCLTILRVKNLRKQLPSLSRQTRTRFMHVAYIQGGQRFANFCCTSFKTNIYNDTEGVS